MTQIFCTRTIQRCWPYTRILKYYTETTFLSFLKFLHCFILQLYCPIGISHMGNLVALPRESQLWQNHATQPTLHAASFSVSIIHQTLTWTKGSFTCTQMLMHPFAHRGCKDTGKGVCTESWLCGKSPLFVQCIFVHLFCSSSTFQAIRAKKKIIFYSFILTCAQGLPIKYNSTN